MAWSTSDLTNDTILNDGTGAMNHIASGTIYVGQAVYACCDDKVMITTSTASECEAIGIASINATNNERIGVYQYGNMVRCCIDAAGNPGVPVYGSDYGVLSTTKGNAKKVAGYIIETPTLGVGGTNYVGKVLLV